MSYIIRTAAVTQKSANREFNGDNLNLNGKVLSMENADKGFKGAGSMNAPFSVAMSSSEYNGFAGAALTALNDRLAGLKEDENNFANVLDAYFADSRHALEKCGCDANGLSIAVLVGYENSLVAARMGDICILRYSDGELTKVGYVPQSETEERPQCSCEMIEDIVNGDLYVLCSENVLAALTEGEIIVTLNAADGNEKKAVQMLTAKFAKRNPDVSATFAVVRIVEQAPVSAAAPVVAAVETAQAPAATVPPAEKEDDNVYEPENEEDELTEESGNSRKNILMWVILCVALVLVMAIAGFAAYKISFTRNHSDVAVGVVVAGSDAQYDIEIVTDAPITEEATEEVTEVATEEATEEATQEPTEAVTTQSSDDDEDDYYYDDDEDEDDYYYDDDEDVTTVEPVTRPVVDDPTEEPTDPPVVEPDETSSDTPIEAPTDAPTEDPEDNPIEDPEDNSEGNGDTFEETV